MTGETPARPRQENTAFLVTLGAATFMLMRWSIHLIGLVSTAVLARLLTPADFGLVAIGTSYVMLLNSISNLGVRTALIRHLDDTRDFADTVFTLQVMRGLALALVVATSGLVLPDLMNDKRLQQIVFCLALYPLVSSLLSPQMALFERKLSFWREITVQVSGKALGTITSITVALMFRSYWALIAGLLAQTTTTIVVSYILAPFVPRLGLRSWRQLLHFSGWLSGASLLTSLGGGMDNMIVGAFRGVRATGIFNVGQQLATMPLGEFLPVVNRALFPGLLRFKDDPDKLRINALEVMVILAGLSLPIAVGFSFVANEFVAIVYGQKWKDAASLVRFIALADAIGSIGAGVAYSVGMTANRTDLLFRRGLLFCLLRLPAFAIGTWLYGLNGAIFGNFVGACSMMMTNLDTLRTLLKTTFGELAQYLWRPIAATSVMALGLFLLQQLLLETSWNPGTLLAAKVLAGVALYVAARLSLWRLIGKPDSFDARALLTLKHLGKRIRKSS